MAVEKKALRRIVTGSVLFILGAVIYVLTEAIAAHAWNDPPYRYAYNYISDLGVAGPLAIEGREVLSPLAGVMNFGFEAHGVLFALGYLLVWPMFEGRARIVACAAAAVHGVGNFMIGYFPGVSYDGASPHLIGAGMAIVGGNLAVLLAGWSVRRSYPRLGRIGAALGVFGIAALAVMVSGISGYPAVFERLSVYTLTAWDLIFGFGVLLTCAPALRRAKAG